VKNEELITKIQKLKKEKKVSNEKSETENIPNNEQPIKESMVEVPKEALTPEEIRRQKHREYMKEYYQKHREKISAQAKERYLRSMDRRLAYNHEYYQKNRDKMLAEMREYYRRKRDELLAKDREFYQKNRERILAEKKERYHSDPKYRIRARKYGEELREEYKRFKIEFGGKCSVCGESDLDKLTEHHPNRKEEKGVGFIHTKEFRDWLRFGIKPNVFLMCASCHLKLEIMIKRKKIAPKTLEEICSLLSNQEVFNTIYNLHT